MSLRFALPALCLFAPALASAQTYPYYVSFENGFQCTAYSECSGPTSCSGPDRGICAEIATGETVCVENAETRFNLVCCGMDEECEDADGAQGKCVTINQPEGFPFGVCVWDSPRSFDFCAPLLTTPTYSSIVACAGTVSTENPSLTEKILVGDCDGDGVLNAHDQCPCEYAGPTETDGCPSTIPDAGTDASVSVDASVSSDSGTGGDRDASLVAVDQVEFGGGGGCEGCAAGETDSTGLGLVVLAMLGLVTLRRRR